MYDQIFYGGKGWWLGKGVVNDLEVGWWGSLRDLSKTSQALKVSPLLPLPSPAPEYFNRTHNPVTLQPNGLPVLPVQPLDFSDEQSTTAEK